MKSKHVSLLKQVRIEKLKDDWPIDGAAEFVATILKQHNQINSLLLPKDLVEGVKEIIDNSASIYPHWQQISVST